VLCGLSACQHAHVIPLCDTYHPLPRVGQRAALVEQVADQCAQGVGVVAFLDDAARQGAAFEQLDGGVLVCDLSVAVGSQVDRAPGDLDLIEACGLPRLDDLVCDALPIGLECFELVLCLADLVNS